MTGVQTSQIRAGDVGSCRGLDGIGLRRAATSPMGSAEICAGSIFPLVNGLILRNLRIFTLSIAACAGPFCHWGAEEVRKHWIAWCRTRMVTGASVGMAKGLMPRACRNELRFGGVAVVGLRRQLGWCVSCCGSLCCGSSSRLGQLSESSGAHAGTRCPKLLIRVCAACGLLCLPAIRHARARQPSTDGPADTTNEPRKSIPRLTPWWSDHQFG